MKATNRKLDIVWQADVRFAVAVRPAHGVAQIVNLPRRRLAVGGLSKRLHGSRIANPRYSRRPVGATPSRSGELAVHLHIG